MKHMYITGNKIQEYRKKHGLTQEEFAKQIGVSIRTIQNYENGAKIPESKKGLFDSLLNIEEYDQTINAIKIDSDLADKFTHITDNQLCAYIIIREKELMKNKMFKLFIDKIANEQAFKIIKDL